MTPEEAPDHAVSQTPSGPSGRAAAASPEAWVALLFGVAATGFALTRAYIDDEGYLTYLGAHLVAERPVDALFFQKIHPPLSALLAPFAALGWRVFLLAHVLMATGAVYMVGRTGRRWWGDRGWLAGLFMALSPLHLFSAVTGQSNSGGIFFLALALFLHRDEGRGRFVAGLVAGAALWSRYEQALYLGGFVLYDVLRRRDGRFVLGFVALPAAYVIAGALYHGELGWVFHYPPAMVRPAGPSGEGAPVVGLGFLGDELRRIVLTSPALLIPFCVLGWREHRPLLWALVLMLLASFVAQSVLPFAGELFDYDFSPRYMLNHLVVASLVAAGLLQAWRPGPRAASLVLACLGLVLLALGWGEPTHRLFAPALILPAVLTLMVRRRAVIGLVGGCVVALGLGFASPLSDRYVGGRSDLIRTVDFVEARALAAPVFTNAKRLDGVLRNRGSALRVRFLAGYDMVAALGSLLHVGHRQAPAIVDALTPVLYGDAFWPCEFPQTIPRGALLVLTPDERVRGVYPVEAWLAASEPIATFGGSEYVVYRAREDVMLPRMPAPPWMKPESVCLPCPGVCAGAGGPAGGDE